LENWNTKKVKNIVAQDRGFRRRVEGERKAANKLKLRAQLYKFVIGSVLDDTLTDHSSQEGPPLSPVRSLTPVVDGGNVTTTFGVDVNAARAKHNPL